MQTESNLDFALSHLAPPSPWTAARGTPEELNAESTQRRLATLQEQLAAQSRVYDGDPHAFLMSRTMHVPLQGIGYQEELGSGSYVARPMIDESQGIGA